MIAMVIRDDVAHTLLFLVVIVGLTASAFLIGILLSWLAKRLGVEF
jgi:cytochrome bd-type quinol oxidase subunit 1